MSFTTPSKDLALSLSRDLNFNSAERSSPQSRRACELLITSFLDDRIKGAVKALFDPESTTAHLKVFQLSQEASWCWKPHFPRQKHRLTTLSIDQSHPMAVVIVMNALLMFPNEIATLNLINLEPAATHEIPMLMKIANCAITALGVHHLELEAVRKLLPAFKDPKIKTLHLKELPVDAVQLIVDNLWEDRNTGTKTIDVSSDLSLPLQLADRIKAFNQLSLVAQQPSRRTSLRPRIGGRYSSIQSPQKTPSSQHRKTGGTKRKSLEPNASDKVKESKIFE